MRHFHGLQYLRALAAMAVVIHHSGGFDAGQAGVDLFFVLSGFLMWSITSADTRPVSFLAARARRIIPAYWIVTTVMLMGGLLSLFPAMILTPWHVVSSYIFIPSISPSNGHIWPLLVPGWSLNYEVFFYLIFAATLFASRRSQLLVLTVTFFMLAVIGVIIRPASTIGMFYTHPIILEFLLGIFIAVIWNRPSPSKTIGLILISSALLWFVTANVFSSLPRLLAWGPPAGLLVLGSLVLERAGAMTKLAAIEKLGDASYSIYLWHTLAIAVGKKIILLTPNFPTVLIFPFLAIAGVFTGLSAYYATELPIRLFFEWRRSAVRSTAVLSPSR